MGCGSAEAIDDKSQSEKQNSETSQMQSKLNEIKKRRINKNFQNTQEDLEKEASNKNVKQRKNKINRIPEETNENDREPYNPYNIPRTQIKQKLQYPSARIRQLKQRKANKEKHDYNKRSKNVRPFDNEEIMPQPTNNSRDNGENEYEKIHSKYAHELKKLNIDKFGDPKEKNLNDKSIKKEVVKKRDNSTQKNDIEEDFNSMKKYQERQFGSKNNEKKFNEKGFISENKTLQNSKKKDSSNEMKFNPIENGYNRNTNESANNNDLTQKTYIDPKLDKRYSEKNIIPFIKKNDSFREMRVPPNKKNSLRIVPLNYDDKDDKNIFISDSPLNNALSTDNRNISKLRPLDKLNTNNLGVNFDNQGLKNSKSQKNEEQLKFIEKLPLNLQRNYNPAFDKQNLNIKDDDDIPQFPSISESFKQNNNTNQTNSKTLISKNKFNDESKDLNSNIKYDLKRPMETNKREEQLLINSGLPNNNEMIEDILKNSLIYSPDKEPKVNVNQNKDKRDSQLLDSKLIEKNCQSENLNKNNPSDIKKNKLLPMENLNRINIESGNHSESIMKAGDQLKVPANIQDDKSKAEELAINQGKKYKVNEESKDGQTNLNTVNVPIVIQQSNIKSNSNMNPSIALPAKELKKEKEPENANLKSNENELENNVNANEEVLEGSSIESNSEEAKETEIPKSEMILEKLSYLT